MDVKALGVSILMAATASCGVGGAGYDGLWMANSEVNGFLQCISEAISGGHFSSTGTDYGPPSTCGNGDGGLSLVGSINSSGVLSGTWSHTFCGPAIDGTFAGSCDNNTSCMATGTGFSVMLTKQGSAEAAMGSCTVTMNGLPPAGTITTCTDYGMGFTTVLAQQSCSAGMYSTDPCPAANRVGRCMISGPCDASTVSYYAPTTLMQAQMECTYLYRQPYTAFFTPG